MSVKCQHWKGINVQCESPATEQVYGSWLCLKHAKLSAHVAGLVRASLDRAEDMADIVFQFKSLGVNLEFGNDDDPFVLSIDAAKKVLALIGKSVDTNPPGSVE